MNELGRYYEVHQKKVWEVYAYNESDAIGLVRNGLGSVMEDEMFVDKTSEAVDE